MKKRGTFLAFAFCLAAVVGLTLLCFKPYSSAVTVEGIRFGLNSGAGAQMGEDCYEIAPAHDFSAVFAFDHWEQTRHAPVGDPVLRLRLAEEWVIALYAEGRASVHYGYASPKTKGDAYYTIPPSVVTAVAAYIEETGERQENPFNESYFRH